MYLIAAKIGLSLAFFHPSISPVWPPTGISLAAALLLGNSVWPGIALGAFLANFLFTRASILLALGIAVGNTLESIVGAALYRRFQGQTSPLDRLHNLFVFILLSVVVGTSISAAIGVTLLSLSRGTPWRDFGSLWLTWWLGDAMGALVFTPAVLCWMEREWRGSRSWIEGAALVGVASLYSVFVFSIWPRFPIHFVFPILVWASLRFGHRGVTTCLILVTTIAVWGTLRGAGPFLEGTLNDSLLRLQLFLASASVTALALATAVTENRKARRLLQEQTKRLERSNVELERFALAASHDLREPLRIIKLHGELLKVRYRKFFDEDGNQILAEINGSANRLGCLINDLLQFARVEVPTGNIPTVDTNEALRLALESLRFAIRESGAEIECGTMPVTPANLSLLAQVFQNLIGNSLKFRGEERPKVEVQAKRRDGEWLFSVKDHGIGFDLSGAGNLFTMFKRLHSSSEYPGSGIGLATCKKIIEGHGGKIWAASEPGKGATFFFTLPGAMRPG